MIPGIIASANIAPQPPAFATAFFDSDPMLSAGWEPVTGPSAFYESGQDKTYVAWQFVGADKGVHVAAYDHTAGAWSERYTAGNFKLPNDDHGHPAIVRDADGYFYAFFGSHNGVQRWSITNAPDDISSWTQQTSIAGAWTYPKALLVGTTIYLMVRNSSTMSRRTLSLMTATPSSGSATFSAATTLVDFDADSRVYQAEAHVRGTDIHFICARANSSDSERKGVYYFIYDTTDGSVKNFDSSVSVASGSLPVDLTTANTSFRVYDHGSNMGELGSLQFDTSGNAHVIFAEGTTSPYDLKHMFLSGGSWSTPETIAAIEDRSPTTGYLDTYTLVPMASGAMGAWYNQTGNKVRRVYSGGMWGSPEVMAEADVYDFVQGIAVRDAHADLRVLFAENLGNTTDSNAVPLGLFGHGDSGFMSDVIDMTPIDTTWDDTVLLLGDSIIDESPATVQGGLAGNAFFDVANPLFGYRSLRLDGSGDYASFTQTTGLYSVGTGDFSIGAWIKLNELGRIQTIFNKRSSGTAHEFSLGILTNNTVYFQAFNNGTAVLNFASTAVLTTGVWYYVEVNRSGTTTYLFIDGNLENSAVQSAAPSTSSAPLLVGRDGFSTARDFNGWINQPRFKRVALHTASFTPPAAAFPRQ